MSRTAPPTHLSVDSAGPATTLVDTLVDAPGPAERDIILVGDSTLLAVEIYGKTDLLGSDVATFDAASCRTIGVESCGGDPRPLNTVETIREFGRGHDAAIVMAGYDEYYTSIESSLIALVEAAAESGVAQVVFLDFRETVNYESPELRLNLSESYELSNDLLEGFESPDSDVEFLVVSWREHSFDQPEWFEFDGIHLTPAGAEALARFIASVSAEL